ncbi:MAG: dTDP-glucose 4,6-dehydratase [Nanoarchaeota archaeon]
MKILVTGGSGFIGSNFILYWVREHPQDFIVNVDALTYAGNSENLASFAKNPRYQFVHTDICDTQKMLEITKDVDLVVHFAAETHNDRAILDPSVFVRTNVLGTQSLLEACRKNKIKHFHHISTDEVYGALPLGTSDTFTEQTPYNPRSPYSASKAAADHLVRAYFHTYSLPVTLTNCSNNLGPFQFPEKIIPLFITNILEGKKVPLYGDGLYVRDWLHVEDHCRAIDLILQKGTKGETYLVGANNEVPNIILAKKILALLGKDTSFIDYVADRPGHDRRYALDSTKIQKLGWKPYYSFDEALHFTVEWYKENTAWWKRLKHKNPH